MVLYASYDKLPDVVQQVQLVKVHHHKKMCDRLICKKNDFNTKIPSHYRNHVYILRTALAYLFAQTEEKKTIAVCRLIYVMKQINMKSEVFARLDSNSTKKLKIKNFLNEKNNIK